MGPVGVLLVWLLVTLIALAGGWALMFYLSWSLILLLAVSYLLAVSGLHALHFDRQTRALRAEVGTFFEEKLVVESRSWLPKLWLEIDDRGEHREHTASGVVSLGPLGRFERRIRTRCRQRGVFRLGPVYARSGDPFGLFRFGRQIGATSTLVVYPVAHDLRSFGRLPGDLPGGGLQGDRVQFTTPNVAGVREYQPGDTFNRIHWATTARQGRLMAKEFELDPFSDIWLVLDLDRAAMTGEGVESTEEYAVTVCASLAKYFLGEDRAIGVVSQGLVLTADRGTRQLLKILELLAYVRVAAGRTLEELLLGEQQRFGRTDHLVVVTATTADGWLRAVRTLGSRGVHASAVVLESSTFGRAPSSLMVVGSLAAVGVPTYLVKQGDSLQRALSAPSVGARRGSI